MAHVWRPQIMKCYACTSLRHTYFWTDVFRRWSTRYTKGRQLSYHKCDSSCLSVVLSEHKYCDIIISTVVHIVVMRMMLCELTVHPDQITIIRITRYSQGLRADRTKLKKTQEPHPDFPSSCDGNWGIAVVFYAFVVFAKYHQNNNVEFCKKKNNK